ncbi:MAG: alpha/beta hydrolase [Candidatus Kerfeldbacteria bacterium]|nr:alpha/beta hydrolase [Candidatus Kerfeldbacteria bacterium]
MNTKDTHNKSPRKWLKMGLFMLLGIIVLIVVLLVLGYIIQVQTSKNFATNFPAPGQLVNVDGHKMHIYCTGVVQPDAPTIILDAGNGRSSLDWSLVQPELSKTTRVCSFDRSGYGWSEPATTPRTGKNIVDEEKQMLEVAGITGPYILVGHSGGGMYARIFAKYYPQDVAGLVLVDSAAVSADTFKPLEDLENAQWQQYYVMKTLATFNILPILGKIGGDKVIPDFVQKLPEEYHEPYLASIARPAYFNVMKAEGDELSTKDDEVWQELNSITNLGNIPIVVLSAQATFAETAGPTAKEVDEYLAKTQKDLLKLSTNSKQVIAEKSNHDIHLDQPELVIQVVQDVMSQVE